MRTNTFLVLLFCLAISATVKAQTYTLGGTVLPSLTNNTGINFDSPVSELQVMKSIDRVGMGTAYLGSGNWPLFTGYVGLNLLRDNVNGKWTVESDGVNNGSGAILMKENASMHFVSIPSSGGSSVTWTDVDVDKHTRMVIDGGKEGNVGIHMFKPVQPLEVNGNIFCTGPQGSVLFGDDLYTPNWGQWGIEYEGGAGGLNFWKPWGSNNFGNYFLFIKDNGNVGIGTSSPAYRLDVCGTIRSKEVKVEIGWCDYVFEDSYKLKPLEEVEAFINEHKHLPDVPSEKEVISNGLNLGEMQATHMLKIEELTLYVIDLKKENEELKQRIMAIEASLKK